ncbi:MAG: radical SAM protein [Lentisphaeria bacterium]|nr:radical SAM protein [Lentisphaeria bacterium]
MSRYVFGPIASRRLGRSLGVDLVRAKTCSLDCVYCEAGATTRHTLERTEAVPVDDVIAELRSLLSTAPELDYVTFSGAGEPTLNSRIGDVIAFLKKEFPQYRTCLLTNACGFFDPALRQELTGLDVVIPSLDASNEEEFQKINRPAPGLTFPMLMEGLQAFCQESSARILLELFIVPGVNDSPESVERFAGLIRTLRLDRIQLNMLDRPGVASWVVPPPPETVERFRMALENIAPVDCAAPKPQENAADTVRRTEMVCRILELTEKNPADAGSLAAAVQVELPVVEANLQRLVAAGLLEKTPAGYKKRGA